LGIKAVERARVWYWNGEDPMDELQRRVTAAAMHYGIEPAELEGWLFLDSGRTSEIVAATQTKEGAQIASPVVEAFEATIRANGIGVAILDPFVSLHAVAENDNGAIDRVAKTFSAVADRTRCAIELVHHVRKTGANEVTVEDGRGAVALLNTARCARAINPMTQEEAERWRVENRRRFFRFTEGKANLAPPAEVSTWQQLISFDLRNGTAERLSDLVGVVASWTPPSALDRVTTEHLAEVRRRCRVEDYRKDSQARGATPWIGTLVAEVAGLDLDSKADKVTVKAALKAWFDSKALLLSGRTKDEKGRPRSPVVRPGDYTD
jgi:hypothetical protein